MAIGVRIKSLHSSKASNIVSIKTTMQVSTLEVAYIKIGDGFL